MRKKLLISIISCFLVVLPAGSQTVEGTIAWGKQQMTLGEYEHALKAFRRASFFSNDINYNNLTVLMAVCLEKTGSPGEAVRLIDHSIKQEPDPASIVDLKLKKAGLLSEMQEYDQSLEVLLKLQSSLSLRQYHLKEYYLGINYFKKEYYPESAVHFGNLLQTEKRRKELDRLFEEYYHLLNKYKPQKAILLNLLLPGTGYIYAGETRNGLKSLLLTGGAVALFGVTARYESFTDGVISILPWFRKTYIGGTEGAVKTINIKLKKAQADIYNKIIHLTEPEVE